MSRAQERKFAQRKAFNLAVRDWFCTRHNLPVIPVNFMKLGPLINGVHHPAIFAYFEGQERCEVRKQLMKTHIDIALFNQKEYDDSSQTHGGRGITPEHDAV